MMIVRRAARARVVLKLAAVTLLVLASAVAGTATATAGTSPAASAPAAASTRAQAGRPLKARALPLKSVIGKPVRHVTPQAFPKQFTQRPRAAATARGESAACPAPSRPGQAQCMSVTAAAATSGYTPAQLQSAYGLTTAALTGGISDDAPETVAIVDAYGDPNAASDLAAYRTAEGEIPCVSASGGSEPVGSGCLTVVNQDNQASPLPAAPTAAQGDWTLEESADIDTVSALCPLCQILLVEANSDGVSDLAQAEVTAENDADFVANGWGSPEFFGETEGDQSYLNAPGKALVFPAGDNGYGTAWPAASQYVTSAGGTTLTADTSASRGWDETAWTGSGAGCATADPKPSWQTADDTSPNGCLNRTMNDIAADADPSTGVAVYDSTAYTGTAARSAGWGTDGGTSVAASLITAAYALAGLPQPGTYPASYSYQSSATAGLNAITSGSDGTCESNRSYLCQAGTSTGYNGPAGNGSPNGTAALTYSGGDTVTVPDPGTQDFAWDQDVSIPVQAASSSGQTLTYSAVGLPSGLSINSATGLISGKTPETSGTSNVTVIASDGTSTGSVSFSIVIIQSLATSFTPTSGHAVVSSGSVCMNDANAATAAGSPVETYGCESAASENWMFIAQADPGAPGTIELGSDHSDCLDITGGATASGSKIELNACDSAASQQWKIESGGLLLNPASERCLTDPGGSTTNDTQLDIENCTGATSQQWTLPASPIQSGINGDCLDDYQQSTANGTKADIFPCNASVSQEWIVEPDATIRVQGTCLDMTGASTLDGGEADIYSCGSNWGSQEWILGPQGQIENVTSGKCLDDPGNSTVEGTQLVQEDCYGQAGELWEVS